MVAGSENEDEIMLREREETLRKDRIKQAKWYESLNLYAEALRIYRTIEDPDNIKRLEGKMREEYGKQALRLERQGRYQDAANLYFLIGDSNGVGRMRKMKPDLVILYDKESGGLARIASSLGGLEEVEEQEDHFSQPNVEEVEAPVEASEEPPMESKIVKKKVPVKVPKGKRMRFCPFCGEEIATKKEPAFCPYCGEDIR
jgi:hypothetical protein